MEKGQKPPSYQPACKLVQLTTQAKAAMVIIIGGALADGWHYSGPEGLRIPMANILRNIADALEGQKSANASAVGPLPN